MGRIIDLTGRKFGRLKVVKLTEFKGSDGSYKWLCHCDCGNETIVNGCSLRSGTTKSCGCTTRLLDLTGQRFGRLTVIKRIEDYVAPKGRHETRWLCKCDCGNETNTTTVSLRSGNTKSCGCYNKERAIEANKKYNQWELFMTTNKAVGTDSKGRRFTIDIEDWIKCKDYCWFVDTQGYVATQINGKHTHLHRFIMNPPKDMLIDHINGDRANNCKSNLRIVTQQQNNMNRTISKNNKSGCTGVFWSTQDNKWIAHITYNYKYIQLGSFTHKEDAIKARQDAELKYYGEYRRT